MKPPPFEYHDPSSVAEALALLRSCSNAKLLAGGQSLMPMLNMRYVQPDHVIDLNKIKSLSYVREDDGAVCIGAMTRQRDLEFNALIQQRLPLMHEALLCVGHRQTRNRGTIGGSLCHLDPAAEMPTVMMAYDGTIEVTGQSGTRDVGMADFPAFYMTPAIEADELVTGMRLTPWRAGHGYAFIEFARRHGDFALASVAVLLEMNGAAINRASITIGGLARKPTRLHDAEHMLVQETPGEAAFRRAASSCDTIDTTSDVHGSASYRKSIAATLTARALAQAHRRALSMQASSPA